MKFYIYRPNGMLVTNTQFDTGGPKFVPTSCRRDFAFTYPSKGPRTITAIATDRDGRMSIRSFALNVDSALPKLTILSPTGPVGYGGFNVVVHKASVSDAEDGSVCCTVTWHSDKDGQLGVGKEVEVVYTSPGTRTITATATDSDGASISKSFALEVRGSPPFVSIDVPAPKAAVFQNTVVVAHALSSDVNEPFGLPCTSLTWSSSKAGDAAFPFTGCGKAISFPTSERRRP